MTVSDLRNEDIYRIVSVMRDCDAVLSDVSESIAVSMFVAQDDFAIIKSAALLFGRISSLLNVKIGSCLNGLPVVTLKAEDVEEFNLAMEEIYFGNFSICSAYDEYLNKTGITEDYGYIYPDILSEMIDILRAEAAVRGEEFDEDSASELTCSRIKAEYVAELSKDLPEFTDELIELVRDSGFYANVFYLHSKRVGNFFSHKRELKEVLEKELFDAINFLIDAVFEPVYEYCDSAMLGTMNANGEYCSVYCMGDYANSGDHICCLNKRPYANLALELLNRLLTDAEKLAPELLLEYRKEV